MEILTDRLYTQSTGNKVVTPVTYKLSDHEVGTITHYLDGDHTDKSKDELKRLIEESNYKYRYADRYTTEKIDEATELIESFTRDLDQIKVATLEAVEEQLEVLVAQTMVSVQEEIDNIKTDVGSVVKRVGQVERVLANPLETEEADAVTGEVPRVTPWESGKRYAPESLLAYKGDHYRVLKDHTSAGTSTPDTTPDLYEKVN